jgi:hypothetical protein
MSHLRFDTLGRLACSRAMEQVADGLAPSIRSPLTGSRIGVGWQVEQ